MASDLPESYPSATVMARALSSYIDDAAVVRRAVLDCFRQSPDLHTIARMRAEHLRAPLPEEPHKPHEGYYPADQSERLAETSKRFLAALERERLRSLEVAMSQGALHSPALRQQAIVDRAWDREVEAAFRLNSEFGK